MLIHRIMARAAFSVVLILNLSACGGGGDGGGSGQPSSPTVTTSVAIPSVDNAVIGGDVNPNGLAATAWFEYGTDASLSTFTKTPDQAITDGTITHSINASLTGLGMGRTYYYRVAASNSTGTSKGEIKFFTTVLLPPAVATSAASSTPDNAVISGDVNPNGLATTAWFEYGPDATMSTFSKTADQPIAAGTATQSINETLTGLTAGAQYYYRVAASSSAGTSRGETGTFTTSQIPSVVTNPATPVTSTNATLNGSVNPNGLLTSYNFVWGTDPNLTTGTQSTTPVSIPAGRFTSLSVSEPLSGLNTGTTYYFRVKATNAAGMSEGTIIQFITLVSPTVNTTAATSITTTGAVLSGDVNPNGYATDAWFEYGTNPTLSSSTSTTHLAKGSGTTTLSFNASISGLSSWRTYYYRAAASNLDGTEKGPIRSFPTGEYYLAVGDSITFGSQDNFSGDDTSLDGRDTGGGFEPILNNLLTATKGYPHTVVNAGVIGATSADGAASIDSTLAAHPNAKYILILYGTNDSDTARGAGYPVPKTTYKTKMQTIITAIINAGKIPYLAKVPYTTDPSRNIASIQGYNAAVNELVVSNVISVTPPDFYTWFQSHPSQLADGVHPDGTGYQSMANLWFNALP